jgi:hypothetical protein
LDLLVGKEDSASKLRSRVFLSVPSRVQRLDFGSRWEIRA